MFILCLVCRHTQKEIKPKEKISVQICIHLFVDVYMQFSSSFFPFFLLGVLTISFFPSLLLLIREGFSNRTDVIEFCQVKILRVLNALETVSYFVPISYDFEMLVSNYLARSMEFRRNNKGNFIYLMNLNIFCKYSFNI